MIIRKLLTVCFVLIAAVEPQSQQQKKIAPDTVLSQPEQINQVKLDSAELRRKIDSVDSEIYKTIKITQKNITKLKMLTQEVKMQNALSNRLSIEVSTIGTPELPVNIQLPAVDTLPARQHTNRLFRFLRIR